MICSKKALYRAFIQYIKLLFKDAMLAVLCFAPILCGLFFRYGIPFIQELLTKYLDLPGLLPPYYLLFDLLLGSLTPVLYCFAAAYVILGEIDDGTSKYLAVTPIGKNGYLFSRLVIPTIIAFVISIAELSIFRLTKNSLLDNLAISFIGSLLGILMALIVAALSGNKVEGMAVSKLTGLIFLGLPAPFFLKGTEQYALSFLPSFWTAKFVMKQDILSLIAGILISFLWISILYHRFLRKIR